MPFPNFRNKHKQDAMFSPKEFMAYQKKMGRYPKFKPPEGLIICYQRKLMDYIIAHHKVKRVEASFLLGDMYLLKETKNQIAIIGNFGIGAPVAVGLLEELIEFGVQRFMSIGTAGTLQKDIKIGSLMVCDRAIRDEGTSHHYIKRAKYSYPSPELTAKVKRKLEEKKKKYFCGTTWTIDAPYRETVAEAKRYQKQGVATVEMEASALFAVAQYRGVPLASLVTISDSLAELEWKPHFRAKRTVKGLETIYQVAVEVLLDK